MSFAFNTNINSGCLHHVLYLLVFVRVTVSQTGECTKVSSCKCIYEDGATIDLSSIAYNDGSPRFQDIPGTSGLDVYSWNPCFDFTEGDCENVAVCQSRPGLPGPSFYSLGKQDSAKFVVNEGKLSIQYSAEMKGVLRTSFVALTCTNGPDDNMLIDGEREGKGTYDLELQSAHACAKGAGTATALSVGTYLLIISFSIVGLYLMVGIPVQIFIRKQSGRNIIPLVDFWLGCPSLVKEGTLFVSRRGRRSGYERK